MANLSAIKQTIKAEAFRLGFALAGLTHTGPPEHFPNFKRWLGQQRHAGMDYLNTPRSLERRADPTRLLPQARSILSLALPYTAPSSEPGDKLRNGDHGQIAAYAWGNDYHDVLLPRLERLIDALEAETQTPVIHRAYTDTGAILEHDLAQRAGLGWIGKNTCLIHPRHGSYFLLSEVLLETELEPDPPFTTDHCGSCTRCIDACPTGCIEPDRTIDAGRCISYLTIENKGTVEPELRPQVGNWIFGCDICQAVCPWNIRFADLAPDPELAPRPGIPNPLLRDELHLTPEGFKRRFDGSPVLRAKRKGYLRNVAVALGNSGNPANIPDLIHSLFNEVEPLVRSHVAWALGRFNTLTVRHALDQALISDPDEAVRQEIRAALENLSNK